MLLINDRHAPVDLEPGVAPVLRWRDDADAMAADPAHGGDPVAVQVAVAETREDALAGRGTVWDCGWIDGDAWGGVTLDGVDMGPSRRYWVSLRWKYADDEVGGWVEPTTFGTGAGREWAAEPIWGPEAGDKKISPLAALGRNDNGDGAFDRNDRADDSLGRDGEADDAAGCDGVDDPVDHDDDAAGLHDRDLGNAAGWALLRGVVTLPDKPIRWATLNATAASTRPARQFVYRMWLNGRFVGVGPTFPIHDEARYDGYDVTNLLRPGCTNAIGVVAYTMDDRRFIAQLDVCYADGSIEHYGTGVSGAHGMTWRALADPSAVYPPSASIGTQYFEAPAENLRGDAYPQYLSDPDVDTGRRQSCTCYCEDATAHGDAGEPECGGWLPVAVKPQFTELLATPTDKLAVRYVRPASLLRVERPVKPGDPDDAAICDPADAADTSDADAQVLSVIVDFGSARMGGIRLNLHPRRPVDVTVRYGEVLNPDGSVKFRLSAGNVYEDHWHVTPGCGPLETWGLRVFRYVEISVAQPPAAPSSWDTPSPTGLDERAAAIEEILLGGDAIGDSDSDTSNTERSKSANVGTSMDRASAVGDIAADRQSEIIPSLSAATLVYPSLDGSTDGYPGMFRSSDPALNRVWQLCAHTIEALNGNIYADSWTRERAAYEADAWLQQRAHLTLDAAPALGAYTIDYLIANRTWPTEWPLYLVLAVHDSWMRSGSTAQIADQYGGLLALLPDRYLDAATGLIVKEPGESSKTDGDLVDWPPSERDGFRFGEGNTVVNALASRAYADMADLARAVGRDDDAERFAAVASRMRASIHERLYDADRGAYVDGLTVVADDGASADADVSVVGDAGVTGVGHDHTVAGSDCVAGKPAAFVAGSRRFTPIDHASLHASAFALAFADVPVERAARVVAFLRSRGMACSVYTAAPYLLGLYGSGAPDAAAAATAMIADRRNAHSWAYMIAQNAGGTMEAWDVARKPNTTYSHPWAASPAFLLPEGLMGVRPLEPGYRRFEVAPQPGAVLAASATMPTPAGDIRVSYRVREGAADGAIELDLTVPSRTRANVILPTAAYRDLAPGRHRLVG
ncbi:alpha-L-rhamnosidase C-terminal domain-containing protein [Bifidobacterium simiiventris]|uniref:alpha-L-rhamnosidase-related protein n=1 Tax=Bifidobacterium simiiventris TaxID=2834434 RepID=UPI001C570F14|nr:alpha-L-rhamnosidase C-terminal domain-containing protein [Bifidobacterium simiiventris]MBW3079416.1 family 78 glycoside hydrolase catalytic domain [Bifidobacterium simiiventris]